MSSYAFNTYSGLFTPEHYERMGKSVWLFLWCISSTTKEQEVDGQTVGIVLGGKPIRNDELGEVFGVNEKTVSRWLRDLKQHGYLDVTRAPYGSIIRVNNSKKWRTDKNVLSERDQTKVSSPDRTEMSDHSESEGRDQTKVSYPDQTKMSDLSNQNLGERTKVSGPERTEMSDLNQKMPSDRTKVSYLPTEKEKRSDKSVRSNKITCTTTTATTTTKELYPEEIVEDYVDKLANRFVELRAHGAFPKPEDFKSISRTLAKVPGEHALRLLEQCFEEKKDKQIKAFAFCEPYIIDRYQGIKSYEQAKKEVAQSAISQEPIQESDPLAMKLATYFFDARKKIDPLLSAPNFYEWAQEIQILLEKKRTEEQIVYVIDWLANHYHWMGRITKPAELVKNFEEMVAQITAERKRAEPSKATPKSKPRPNKQWNNRRSENLPEWLLKEREEEEAAFKLGVSLEEYRKLGCPADLEELEKARVQPKIETTEKISDAKERFEAMLAKLNQ